MLLAHGLTESERLHCACLAEEVLLLCLLLGCKSCLAVLESAEVNFSAFVALIESAVVHGKFFQLSVVVITGSLESLVVVESLLMCLEDCLLLDLVLELVHGCEGFLKDWHVVIKLDWGLAAWAVQKAESDA